MAVSCGLFWALRPVQGTQDMQGIQKAAGRLPQAGMQGIQEPVELPQLGEVEQFRPSFAVAYTRNLPKLSR